MCIFRGCKQRSHLCPVRGPDPGANCRLLRVSMACGHFCLHKRGKPGAQKVLALSGHLSKGSPAHFTNCTICTLNCSTKRIQSRSAVAVEVAQEKKPFHTVSGKPWEKSFQYGMLGFWWDRIACFSFASKDIIYKRYILYFRNNAKNFKYISGVL